MKKLEKEKMEIMEAYIEKLEQMLEKKTKQENELIEHFKKTDKIIKELDGKIFNELTEFEKIFLN